MRKILSIITIVLLMIVICSTQSFAQTGKWAQLLPTHSPPARCEHGMAYLGDDKILLFGGGSSEVGEFGDTWIYDLSDNEWTEIKCDSSPFPRDAPAMVNIGEGKVLLFGGGIYDDTYYVNDTWIFDLETLKWTELHPIQKPYQRYRSACAYLGDNKVLLFSGEFCPLSYSKYRDGKCHDTWIYDLIKNEWDSVANDYPRGRELSQMCELSTNDILLYGGHPSTFDIYIFSKNLSLWQLFIPKVNNLVRVSSSMVNLKENVTFVFGGGTQGNPSSTAEDKYSDDSWIFDFEDSTWIQIFPDITPKARYMHNMAKIGFGKAILFGGIIPGAVTNDTWLFEYEPTGINDSNNILLATISIVYLDSFNYEIILKNLCEGAIDIELYDINGNLLKNLYSNFNFQKELNLNMNFAEFNTGSYFVVIKTKSANYYKQIIIAH